MCNRRLNHDDERARHFGARKEIRFKGPRAPGKWICDNITLYWLTNTAASSARFYWNNARAATGFSAGRIELPMAASIFPREIYRVPKSWAQALWPNLIYWNELDRGGHFAAWEEPALFVNELRAAFRSVREA